MKRRSPSKGTRVALKGARDRQASIKTFVMPEGFDKTTISDHWENLDVVKPAKPTPPKPDSQVQLDTDDESAPESHSVLVAEDKAAAAAQETSKGARSSPSKKEKTPVFREAKGRIKHLRSLSAQGRKETQRLEALDRGKAQVVYNAAGYNSNRKIEHEEGGYAQDEAGPDVKSQKDFGR